MALSYGDDAVVVYIRLLARVLVPVIELRVPAASED